MGTNLSKFWRLISPAMPTRLKRELLYLRAYGTIIPSKPVGFMEKVNWRILHDRRDLIAIGGDKLRMKDYVSVVAPDVLIPETLWAGTEYGDVLDRDFGPAWILKPIAGSGKAIFGSGTPRECGLEASEFDKWSNSVHYRSFGEWAYSQGRPGALIERSIAVDEAGPPNDFRFYVTAGEVQLIQVDTPRSTVVRRRFYNLEWTPLEVTQGGKELSDPIDRPGSLDEMISIASRIGKAFDFIRVDLYDTAQGIYFGELTPYPTGGLNPFSDKDLDLELGRKWELPQP